VTSGPEAGNRAQGAVLPTPTIVVVCYHDGMDRKITTVRLPEDLAETAEVVARGKGVSVNALIVDALAAEIDRVKADADFMASLRALTERDREILDRLAE